MKDIIIKGKYVVHIIYLLIIFILIVLLIAEIYHIRVCVNPQQSQASSSQTNPTSALTGKVVDVGSGKAIQTYSSQKNSAASISNTKNTTKNITNISSNSSNIINETSNVTVEAGKIKFILEDFSFEEKGDDWATITKLKYTIANGKEDFYPIIVVYLYDDDSSGSVKGLQQDVIELTLLEEGEVVTKESPVHISYNNIDMTKTLKLVLKNELGKDLKTASKEFDTR